MTSVKNGYHWLSQELYQLLKLLLVQRFYNDLHLFRILVYGDFRIWKFLANCFSKVRSTSHETQSHWGFVHVCAKYEFMAILKVRYQHIPAM